MVEISQFGAYLINGKEVIFDCLDNKNEIQAKVMDAKEEARKNTITYSILEAHNKSENKNMEKLALRFDALASHDITYVGIIQTARASGLTKFPMPYVLTNCHNSLCAVGGTINEDDHLFGLTAAQKYGGIYVPAHMAVIHQYMREMMAGCGKMILGSDSHTRYGALGTMAIGEGGGELAKQILNKTYDINRPDVIGVYMKNEPQAGVGPQDIALAIIKAVFENGYVKNKVMEFFGPGVSKLGVEYRNGIDVMTTETTCLSSIWVTDDKVEEYLDNHGRSVDYKKLTPGEVAYYDGLITVDMAKIKPMIAMPFHPSNVYTIEDVINNPSEILATVEKTANSQLDGSVKLSLLDKIKDGKIHVDQGVIAGCAGGTYDNICDCADMLEGKSIGSGAFALSVYPSSQPTFLRLVENGAIAKIMTAGATVRSAFCGPCFGAGDVPFNNGFSIRHTTRNFQNREGSKPSNGQIAGVALMDARSVAATAINNGVLTPATDISVSFSKPVYYFNNAVYENRVLFRFGKEDEKTELTFGPNITDWPKMPKLSEHLLLRAAAVITDPVTTTDELIPSGETSSFRSNPLGLAEFTLSRKEPQYVPRAKAIQKEENLRQAGNKTSFDEQIQECKKICLTADRSNIGIGSVIYAVMPGDGSAREQAASCQKVLGGYANIAVEYATKRYRSNLINWGIVPFLCKGKPPVQVNDFIFIPNIRKAVEEGTETVSAYVFGTENKKIELQIIEMTYDERKILLSGCLINYYNSADSEN